MGFGLSLSIPDPRQWRKQQVPHAIVDEQRVSKGPSNTVLKNYKILLTRISGTLKLEEYAGKTRLSKYCRFHGLNRP